MVVVSGGGLAGRWGYRPARDLLCRVVLIGFFFGWFAAVDDDLLNL